MQDKPNSIWSQLHPTNLTFLPWSIYDMAKVKSLKESVQTFGAHAALNKWVGASWENPWSMQGWRQVAEYHLSLGSVYAVHSTRFLWKEVAELSGSCPQWQIAQMCTLDRLFFILQNPSSVPWDHFSKIHSPKHIVQALLFLQELEVGGT